MARANQLRRRAEKSHKSFPAKVMRNIIKLLIPSSSSTIMSLPTFMATYSCLLGQSTTESFLRAGTGARI
jgi:hypothetical protein